MATISNAFTGTGNGTAHRVRHGDVVRYTVSGTFAATWVFEISLNGGSSYSTIDTGTAAKTVVKTCNTSDKGVADFRFRCSAYTSGTMNTTLSDHGARKR